MSLPVYGIFAFLSALLFTFSLLLVLIPRLRAMRMGQRILEIGPVWHAPKEGTPTMGGISFLLVCLPLGLLFLWLCSREYPMTDLYPFAVGLIYCIANGAVGIVDDLTKLRHHRNEGLTPTQKIVLQVTLAAAYLALLRLSGILDSRLPIPILGVTVDLGFATYFVLMLLLVGVGNCANLTDGIDGLAATVGLVIFAFLTFSAVLLESISALLLSSMLAGCCLSFLFFNRHPARIFMGDTGSLFLGATAAAVPMMLGRPLIILLCGIVFIIEGASVILQVLYYKRTKKRLFLMAPLHHHLEKCGWSENKIVFVFAALTLLACLLAHFLPA